MDQLGRAIRQSLDDQRSASRANEPKRGWGGLSAIAADAQQLAESARDALADGAGGARTERRLVVGALLVHSLDIAWATCQMLKTEAKRTHMVALTLWRPLLEHWLRAAFFTLEATDDEVTAFRTAGTIPTRSYPSNPQNRIAISIRLIAKLVGPVFSPTAPGLLSEVADEEDWHGFVHGGDIVVNLLDSGETFESTIPPDDVAKMVQRIAVISCLCGLTGIMLSSKDRPDAELKPISARLADAMDEFLDRWPSARFQAPSR